MITIYDKKYLQLTDLTPDQYSYYMKNIYNGVGSRSYSINPRDFIFKKAAEYHDFRYISGGTENNRLESDLEYDLWAKKAIQDEPNIFLRNFYKLVHKIYFYVLQKLGKNAWEYYDEPSKTWDEFIERFQKSESPKKLAWIKTQRNKIFL